MSETSNSPEQQERGPEYKIEDVHYNDNSNVVMRVTGDKGVEYKFGRDLDRAFTSDDIAYDPVRGRSHTAIVSTEKGNILLTHDTSGFYDQTGSKLLVVDMDESQRKGELVGAVTEEYQPSIPPIEFGKPWSIPGVLETSDVKELLLTKFHEAKPGREQKIDEKSPFVKGLKLIHNIDMVPKGGLQKIVTEPK